MTKKNKKKIKRDGFIHTTRKTAKTMTRWDLRSLTTKNDIYDGRPAKRKKRR